MLVEVTSGEGGNGRGSRRSDLLPRAAGRGSRGVGRPCGGTKTGSREGRLGLTVVEEDAGRNIGGRGRAGGAGGRYV